MSKTKKEIPKFGVPIIETHCHLDSLKAEPILEILSNANQYGVERFITISASADTLQKTMELASLPNVWCTQGIHPHDAELFTSEIHEQIISNIASDKVVAIGEIGLDYFYSHSERKIQQHVFETQLQIAADSGLPFVVHTREAEEDTKNILKQFSGKINKSGVIHSFTSSIDLAEFCLGEGYSLGFNGIITFNKAENVRDVVRITPLEKILLETDSPYLTPVPFRGKENSPAYLPLIAKKISEIKSIAVEDVLEQCYKNSMQLFFDE